MMIGPKPVQNKAEVTGKDCQEIAEKVIVQLTKLKKNIPEYHGPSKAKKI